jgi:hypothetical protein
MSTANGWGVRYYGTVDARDDGSIVSTRFIVGAFLPLIPLRTERIKLLNVDAERGEVTTEYAILEQLPLNWAQILHVWSAGYSIVPLIVPGQIFMLNYDTPSKGIAPAAIGILLGAGAAALRGGARKWVPYFCLLLALMNFLVGIGILTNPWLGAPHDPSVPTDIEKQNAELQRRKQG